MARQTKAQKEAAAKAAAPAATVDETNTAGVISSEKVNDANFKASPSVDASKIPKGVKKVTFTLYSGKTRVFDEATHGEDFGDVADEFHASNVKSEENRGARKDHVVSRKNE